MKNIMLVRCCIHEMGKVFVKYCFLHDGVYYDLQNLNVFDVFDGENGIIQSEVLNENDLKEESREVLNRRKEDLVNRLKTSKCDEINLENLKKILNDNNMSFVLYKCSKILLDDLANVYFEELDDMALGIMFNNDVYDIKTQKRVQNIHDDLVFGDVCLTYIKPVPPSIFQAEDYAGLVMIANEIVSSKDKPKIIFLH